MLWCSGSTTDCWFCDLGLVLTLACWEVAMARLLKSTGSWYSLDNHPKKAIHYHHHNYHIIFSLIFFFSLSCTTFQLYLFTRVPPAIQTSSLEVTTLKQRLQYLFIRFSMDNGPITILNYVLKHRAHIYFFQNIFYKGVKLKLN